jgi:hypothetical protein
MTNGFYSALDDIRGSGQSQYALERCRSVVLQKGDVIRVTDGGRFKGDAAQFWLKPPSDDLTDSRKDSALKLSNRAERRREGV